MFSKMLQVWYGIQDNISQIFIAAVTKSPYLTKLAGWWDHGSSTGDVVPWQSCYCQVDRGGLRFPGHASQESWLKMSGFGTEVSRPLKGKGPFLKLQLQDSSTWWCEFTGQLKSWKYASNLWLSSIAAKHLLDGKKNTAKHPISVGDFLKIA